MSRYLLKSLGYRRRSDGDKTPAFDVITPWSKVRGAVRTADGDTVLSADGFSEICIIMPFEEFEKQFEAYLASVEEKK